MCFSLHMNSRTLQTKPKYQVKSRLRVDVYPSEFHALDMLLPFRKISKEAVLAFEEQYLYAQEHYFAEQE